MNKALNVAFVIVTVAIAQVSMADPPGQGQAPGAARDIGGVGFVWCPAGEYMMGSPLDAAGLAAKFGGKAEWYADETPAQKAPVAKGFWMSSLEITRAQWQTVLATEPWGNDPQQDTTVPAANITWGEASSFALEFGKKNNCSARLPSENEWEYACRAGSTEVFYHGSDAEQLSVHAQYRANAPGGRLQPAGALAANAWGLHDILGNAWEWCQDNYTLPSAGRTPSGGGAVRVIRGGAANCTAAMLRCSYRTGLPPDTRSPRVGMRLVVEP